MERHQRELCVQSGGRIGKDTLGIKQDICRGDGHLEMENPSANYALMRKNPEIPAAKAIR
jgi:hypothetical protein